MSVRNRLSAMRGGSGSAMIGAIATRGASGTMTGVTGGAMTSGGIGVESGANATMRGRRGASGMAIGAVSVVHGSGVGSGAERIDSLQPAAVCIVTHV